jgi:hypothetical protein
MGIHRRIVNVTNGFRLKPENAERAILNCSAEWVEKGVTIRSLTLQEAISARNEQAKVREPLAFAEIPGLKFEAPASGLISTRESQGLIRAAHEYCLNAA